MEKTWMKVRTISGKEMLGYITGDLAGKETLELHAPTGLFVDLEKKVHLIPETDANNLKDAVAVISIAAVEAYMVVPDTSELVRAISSQLSGIVLPPAGSKITNINQVKK